MKKVKASAPPARLYGERIPTVRRGSFQSIPERRKRVVWNERWHCGCRTARMMFRESIVSVVDDRQRNEDNSGFF